MRQIGLKPEIMPSMADEEIEAEGPKELVRELSRRKAEEVAARYSEDTLVIGADTVVAVQGRILGKPATHREAVEMLMLLQGQVHQVYTGVTIVAGGTKKVLAGFAECTDVSVYPMDEEEIIRYTESGEPMDKAGAYGIQGKFAAYIREIRGDYHNVVGLPVSRLYQELKTLGFLEELRYD